MSRVGVFVLALPVCVVVAGCGRRSAPPNGTSPGAPTSGEGAEATKEFSVSLVGEDRLKASFVEKAKGAEGYKVTVRFVNTTDMDIAKLSTNCHLYEGDWKIRSWGVMRQGYPSLIPANSHKDIVWIDGVSSSIDRIDIEVLGVE